MVTGSGRGGGDAAAPLDVPEDPPAEDAAGDVLGAGAGALEVGVGEPVIVRVEVDVFGAGASFDSATMALGALTASIVANPEPVWVAIIVRVPPVGVPSEGAGPDGEAELTIMFRSPTET